MTLFTVVDEGYDVNVYTTQKALVTMIFREGWLIAEPQDGEERKKPTLHAIRNAVSALDYVMYLYDPDEDAGTEWKYKVEIQKSVNVNGR